MQSWLFLFRPFFSSLKINWQPRTCRLADRKRARVASFHKETVKALGELVAAAGLDHPRELRSHHFVRRASDATVTFMELYRCLEPGELLTGTSDTRFKESWAMARAESFAPTLDKTSDAAPLAAE